MNITQLTTDQVSSLGNDELADVRDRPAYKATVVENRNVISDEEHRTALHLRALHYAAEDDIEIRQKQPEHKQGGPPHRLKASSPSPGFPRLTRLTIGSIATPASWRHTQAPRGWIMPPSAERPSRRQRTERSTSRLPSITSPS